MGLLLAIGKAVMVGGKWRNGITAAAAVSGQLRRSSPRNPRCEAPLDRGARAFLVGQCVVIRNCVLRMQPGLDHLPEVESGCGRHGGRIAVCVR